MWNITLKKGLLNFVHKCYHKVEIILLPILGLDPEELFLYVRRDPGDQRFYCTLCSLFSHASRTNCRNHVEARHFPNTFHYPCDSCDSTFTTKSTWAMHKSKKHNVRRQQEQTMWMFTCVLEIDDGKNNCWILLPKPFGHYCIFFFTAALKSWFTAALVLTSASRTWLSRCLDCTTHDESDGRLWSVCVAVPWLWQGVQA